MARLDLHLLLLLTLALLVASRPAVAAESYDNCTGFVTSVPAVVTTPGVWCLKQNLTTAMTSGNAIAVNANDVTIDCNDFKLDGLGAGLGTTAHGILASGRTNVTIRNCNIRGFEYGVLLMTGSGQTVEDNHFSANTYAAVRVDGDRSLIRHNEILDSGGSTLVAQAYGILANNSIDILDNTISGVAARRGGGGCAYGILTQSNLAGSINGNRIRAVLKDGVGFGYDIYNSLSDRVTLRDNDLLGDSSDGNRGMRCATSNGSAKNNVINGFGIGLETCSDDGGNVIAN